MSTSLKAPKGKITWYLPEYQDKFRFFNLIESAESTPQAYHFVTFQEYPHYVLQFFRAEGKMGKWEVDPNADRLLQILSGEVRVDFREGEEELGYAIAVEGEICLLPRGVHYTLSAEQRSACMLARQKIEGAE